MVVKTIGLGGIVEKVVNDNATDRRLAVRDNPIPIEQARLRPHLRIRTKRR